jgi:DNA-binding transcriptional LysR family regulator
MAAPPIIGARGMRFIPMQNLTDIAIFVKVVELSSFTAAAEALEMSQPVVSKAVTRLEEKLGARLLNRTTRRLSLTEAGSELYGRSVRALAEIENAELEVARFQTEPRGLLRVSAPMSFSILQLGPAVQSFLTRFPGVTLELSLDDRQVDLVEEGFDVAVRIGRLQDSNLIARKITPCRQVLCASPAYLAQRGEPERPEDLLEHRCILYSLLSAPREWRLVGPEGELHTVPINGTMQSNNGLVNRAAALAGGGIVLLPTFYLAEQLRSGTLKPVLCKFKPQELAVYAIYPERRNLMPKVRAFVDFLATTFGPEPPWEQGWSLPE